MDQYVRVRSLGELFKVVRIVRQAVADGDIEEIDAGPMTMKGLIPFDDLSDNGPLDDVMNYRFRCPTCGKQFALGVVAWNGVGGSWDKAEPLPPS